MSYLRAIIELWSNIVISQIQKFKIIKNSMNLKLQNHLQICRFQKKILFSCLYQKGKLQQIIESTTQNNNRVKYQYNLRNKMQEDPFAIFQAPKRNQPSTTQPNQSTRKRVHIDDDLQQNKKSSDNIGSEQFHQNNKNAMNILEQQLEVNLDEDSENQLMDLQNVKPQDIEIVMERQEQGCIHEVFYPKDYIRKQFNGPYDAKQYKFKLDPFQRKSVHAIQTDQSVLVCAHTSAGKTAIAEYAIAHSLKNKSRVIYTSPIKALSNQKYRQLKDQFVDVGLITGDVTIDQNATCLVMTTEILRNMIYRGSQIVRQVKWVIFDQVHYMRDKQRGVVWQQTIIMLPANVKYVFLSATIGNPSQFATWITKLRKQPCNVVYTDYRPVPLQHYLCPSNGQGLYMVVDDKSKFHEQNFNKAMQAMGESINVIGIDSKKNKKKMNQGSDLFKIIKVIMQQNLDPVIIFSFSKKDVESYAKSVCTKYDLTTKQQKQKIDQVYNNAIDVLNEEDKNLPPIKAMREIIKKGIGIHHGGLLPLLKQVVQLLFQQGLLKVLFSTQTFSMGLNMPARTVVFTAVKKFDGQKARWITGGQYIQMSGRAGRRGLDKKGMTILMLDQKMEPQIAKDMLKGKSDDLLSSFYINYNMLLNSQRLEDIDSDYILSRSLLQFQHQAKLPSIIASHKQKMQQWKSLKFDNQQQLEQLYLLHERAKQHSKRIKELSRIPKNILPYMNIGRIIHLKQGDNDWGLGISINFHKKEMKKGKAQQADSVYLFDIMVYCKPRDVTTGAPPKPAKLDQQGQLCVMTFSINCIQDITIWKIARLPPDLTSASSKKQIHKVLMAYSSKRPQYIPLVSDNPECKIQKKHLDLIEEQILTLKHLQPQLEAYKKKRQVYEQVKKSAKNLKSMSEIVLRKQKKAYYRVMKRTGLIQKGVVTLKGNVACEISSNHQILLTHLLFSGYFNDMSPIQIASVLTALVHEQKSSTQRKVTKQSRLRFKLQQLLRHAKSIFLILKQCKVSIQQDQYMDSIKEQLVQVCYEWCHGATFAQLCKMTDTYEGSIIRTLRRLNQLLKQMSNASNIIGNQQLSNKFIQASQKVFRGIVQAASLYTL